MKYYNENTIVWHNGEYVKAADTKTDLYGQSLHYGYAVFEGIRAYKTASGETKIFREKEHYERLRKSAEALNMPYSWTWEELTEATYNLLEKNNQQDAYIRPLVYAPANMSFALNETSNIVIETWEMAPFLGDKLLRVMNSSFQRPNPKGFYIHAKAAGHYVNSILASQEAKAKGFDEALLSDMNGFIAEGPGANVFFEKDGILYTPAAGNILTGITRATVLEICQTLAIPIVEKQCTLAELQQADAAFFCGTAAEVIGWASIDDSVFPTPWNNSVSRNIQLAYMDIVRQANKVEKNITLKKAGVTAIL
jgi:branched-chain amino acid aminotransferase